MKRSTHECRYWQPSRAGHRGHRWCDFCGRRQVKVLRQGAQVWEDVRSLEWFAERWLPVISGTKPERLMRVDVAYPFEWNCYETWRVVYRVIFQFPGDPGPLVTRTHIMNGWQSKYHECWNRIDAEAEDYYHERTGRWYDIGDNSYAEMRAIIQAPIDQPKPPDLHVVEP